MLILPGQLKGASERSTDLLVNLRGLAKNHSIGGRDQHYVIEARSRGGFILWQGNFWDEKEAWSWWKKLEERSLTFRDYVVPTPHYDPSIIDVPGLHYDFAVVTQFTSTGTTSWVTPTGVTAVSYLAVAGGGGGAGATSGTASGAGAGGFLANASFGVTPGASNTVTVGVGGSSGSSSNGGTGGNSVFSTNTAIGGAGGVQNNGGSFSNGLSGGSGSGGLQNNSASTATGGAGTAGQGNAGGGAVGVGSNTSAGGGGGAGAVGANAPSSGVGGAGGAGSASSISGSSVTYAGGGGGAGNLGQGVGGTGGGGAGKLSTNGIAGTANTGGGGGGGQNGTGGLGGSGIVIMSYSAIGLSSRLGSGSTERAAPNARTSMLGWTRALASGRSLIRGNTPLLGRSGAVVEGRSGIVGATPLAATDTKRSGSQSALVSTSQLTGFGAALVMIRDAPSFPALLASVLSPRSTARMGPFAGTATPQARSRAGGVQRLGPFAGTTPLQTTGKVSASGRGAAAGTTVLLGLVKTAARSLASSTQRASLLGRAVSRLGSTTGLNLKAALLSQLRTTARQNMGPFSGSTTIRATQSAISVFRGALSAPVQLLGAARSQGASGLRALLRVVRPLTARRGGAQAALRGGTTNVLTLAATGSSGRAPSRAATRAVAQLQGRVAAASANKSGIGFSGIVQLFGRIGIVSTIRALFRIARPVQVAFAVTAVSPTLVVTGVEGAVDVNTVLGNVVIASTTVERGSADQ